MEIKDRIMQFIELKGITRNNPNLVGKLSGHKEGSKAFDRYRDIDDDIAQELVRMLE